ncbi:glycosyltransferase [bacterium]|nr:glycosyltransferase [bacterium]
MVNTLFIGKSPSPPWNDSAKNIQKVLLENLKEYYIEYLTDGSYLYSGKRKGRIVYKKTSSYSLSQKEQIRLFFNLLKPDFHIDLYHYFFSPNIKSSLAARFLKLIKPKKIIQSVLSMPKEINDIHTLFFGDQIVTMSNTSQKKLEYLGVSNVSTIYPGINIPLINKDEISHAKHNFHFSSDKTVVLYAGDYTPEIYNIADLAKELKHEGKDFLFVFAIRLKNSYSIEEDRAFRWYVSGKLGLFQDSIRVYNELENFSQLLAASDIMIFTQQDLYAKMDLPLVILEAMSMKKMVIIPKNSMLLEMNIDKNLVVSNTIYEIKDALLSLSKEKKGDIGLRNYQIVKKYFEASVMAKGYEKLYSTVEC